MVDRDWKGRGPDKDESERRPWEGYRARRAQAPDFGSAGGQYSSRVGPDQDPYTRDEGAYFGARPEDGQDPDDWRDWDERAGRGRGGYGQVGGSRETARDEGGYSRASRVGGRRHHGQGGYGEERQWGRDRGSYGPAGYGPGNPPDAGQLAYGPNSQNYGQPVEPGYGRRNRGYGTDGVAAGQGQAEGRHDPDYSQWRQDQARKYDEDYGSWRESQLRRHDDDYETWRKERRDKFGQTFAEWRAQRDGQAAPDTEADADGKKTQ